MNDFDTEFEQVVQSRDYEKDPASHRPISQFVIPDPFPPIRLPDGFRLKSLADDNDLVKIDRKLPGLWLCVIKSVEASVFTTISII